jgi:hypothetical protein
VKEDGIEIGAAVAFTKIQEVFREELKRRGNVRLSL